MRIKLRELRDGRHMLAVNEPAKPHELPGCGALSGELQLEKLGPELIVTGAIAFTARQQCSRCLKDFTRDYHQEIELCYSPRPDARGGDDHESELTSDDLVTIEYQGNEIDLWPELREAVLLTVPLKPLCREDCQGLCPLCGKDRNIADCGCRDDHHDARWDKLRTLKK